MQQNVFAGVAVAVVLGLGFVALNGTGAPISVNAPVNVDLSAAGGSGGEGGVGGEGQGGLAQTGDADGTPLFGSVATLDGVDNPYTSIGGLQTYYAVQTMSATSSTVCSILNPYGATSSIKSIGVSRSATGISGTQAFYVSTTTSTGRYGSSTPAFIDGHQQGAANFALSWKGIVSTSTPRVGVLQTVALDGRDTALLGPSEVITVRIATSSPGTFTTYMTGRCSAVIERL